MTVKFKIGFTISGETLFGLMAKLLPIEDLHVEELPERLPTPTRQAALAHDSPPKIKKRRRSVGTGGGQLKVIADYANAHGVVSHGGIRRALTEQGFAGAGAGSAIARAVKIGFLRRHRDGYVLSEGSTREN